MEPAFMVGGWLAASVAAGIALLSWRARAVRMEVIARVCHELRGPITAARLGLQLGARTAELSPSTMRAIDLELGRAALALEDLSDIPRRRPARARGCEAVDVAELLADCIEAHRCGAVDRGLELELTCAGGPAQVWGDRLRLAQAAGNLIANAIEHGGGAIEVRARAQAGGVRVEVVDGGPGLPAPVAELTSRPRGGRGPRGRGLAIAAAIAKDHGGRLAAAPSERGARLVLELPVARQLTPSQPVPGEDLPNA
jgi:signal transduction histidine kinase